MQLGVGVDDAHQRDVVEIEPLGDHLGAEQHGGIGGGERFQQGLVGAFGLGGVGVHADDGNGWPHTGQPVQELAQLGFHTLGAGAELLQVGAAAFGAGGRRGHGVAAVVADELGPLFVVGERR